MSQGCHGHECQERLRFLCRWSYRPPVDGCFVTADASASLQSHQTSVRRMSKVSDPCGISFVVPSFDRTFLRTNERSIELPFVAGRREHGQGSTEHGK